MKHFQLKPLYERMADVIGWRLSTLELCISRLRSIGLDGVAAVAQDTYDKHIRVAARLAGRKILSGNFQARRRAARTLRREF